jgi:hypothetical protein
MAEPTASAGDVLGAAGAPVSLRFDGKEYPVAYPTLRAIDRIEKLVVRRATDAIAELADVLTPQEMAEAKADLQQKVRAKQHATGGSMWLEEFGADGGARGLLLMFWACLEEAREKVPLATRPDPIPFDEMPRLLAESPDAMNAVALVLPDFTRAVGAKLKLPAASRAKLEERMRDGVAELQKLIAPE